MDGQSIRALAQAPSNPKMLVVGHAEGRLPQRGRRSALGSDQPCEQRGAARGRVDRDRPEGREDHLRRHLAPALEDDRWRRELAQHQAGADRRLGCILDHHRSGNAADGLYQRLLGHLQERQRRRAVPQDPGNSFDRAPHPRADAGSGRSRDRLRRNDRGAVSHNRGGHQLVAPDRAGCHHQRRLRRSEEPQSCVCWRRTAAAC